MREPGAGWKDHDDVFPITVALFLVAIVVVVIVVATAGWGIDALFPSCDKAVDADSVCFGSESDG